VINKLKKFNRLKVGTQVAGLVGEGAYENFIVDHIGYGYAVLCYEGSTTPYEYILEPHDTFFIGYYDVGENGELLEVILDTEQGNRGCGEFGEPLK